MLAILSIHLNSASQTRTHSKRLGRAHNMVHERTVLPAKGLSCLCSGADTVLRACDIAYAQKVIVPGLTLAWGGGVSGNVLLSVGSVGQEGMTSTAVSCFGGD